MSGAIAGYGARHAQALLSSAGHLARAPFATIFTVLVMGLALALPLGLDVMVRNIRTAAGNFSGAVSLTVYFKSGTSERRATELTTAARLRSDVGTVRLITAADALAQFRAQSGFGAALDALLDNPLPHALSITPAASHAGAADLERLRLELGAWPEVESTQLDSDWVLRFNALLALLRRSLLVAGALFGIGVVAVVGNTIRLEIQNRRAEIEVTKLVGGTNGFVRRPFLYTGALYGLLGGVTAWVLVSVALRLMDPAVRQLAATYYSEFVLQGPAPRDLGGLLGAGVVLGWFGSWFAAARHLSEIDPGRP